MSNEILTQFIHEVYGQKTHLVLSYRPPIKGSSRFRAEVQVSDENMIEYKSYFIDLNRYNMWMRERKLEILLDE